MSIITLSEYKAFVGINSPNQDDKLQPVLDMANNFILQYCNTSFSPVAVTERRLTNTGEMIVLPPCPIVSIQELKFIKATDEVLTSDQYILDNEEGVIHIIDYTLTLPSNPFSVSVSYTHGYEQAPDTIRHAAMELITHYDKREFNGSKDLGNGQSIDFNDPQVLPTQVKSLLDVYRVL